MTLADKGVVLLEEWSREKERKETEEKLLATGFFRRGKDGALRKISQSKYPQCGAKTRAGGTCQMRVVLFKKRCRLHGGLSTGAKTAEGRKAIGESNRSRAQKRLRAIELQSAVSEQAFDRQYEISEKG